jgi:GTP-binding protein
MPEYAQEGEEGEERHLELELRLAADIAIIGPPNAGKSSLLARVSRAAPVVADYPFTTREPVPGVVELGFRSIVAMELPGLVKGAHSGRGLGSGFLRHMERSKVALCLLAGDAADPFCDYLDVVDELSAYDRGLAEKPRIVVVNKMDLASVRALAADVKARFQDIGVAVHFISALTGEGVDELMALAASAAEAALPAELEDGTRVFRPRPVPRRR